MISTTFPYLKRAKKVLLIKINSDELSLHKTHFILIVCISAQYPSSENMNSEMLQGSKHSAANRMTVDRYTRILPRGLHKN